ncbi:sensor histidine kinase [Sneathiella aquimaris]|uniref:sensor histidine kinase n=1 Tax=Sneathiella aquimaris TaxID=2599305 RepID=UPI00146DF538|nr:sensor histidine kinase [Sneathiella aquimaris]
MKRNGSGGSADQTHTLTAETKSQQNPGKRIRSTESREARKWGPFSSLGRRIMAINLFSVIFLAGGILYLDQFRSGLIEARLQALVTNGRLIAGALGEAALREVALSGSVQRLTLDSRSIRRVLRRLSVVTNTPARLYDGSGTLIADSRFLISAGREIVFEPLPPPENTGQVRKFFGSLYDFAADLMPVSQDYPLYPGDNSLRSEDFEEVGWALKGDIGTVIRQTKEGQLFLTASIPVQGFKHVLGSLLLIEDGHEIDEAVRAAQVTTLIVISITVVINLLLSLYLARTIAKPVHQMAEAADKVRLGLGRRVDMPDFSARQDEIGDLSTSFREMTAALYDRMDAVEAFAADVAHELKNPLTSLGTAVDTFGRVKDAETRKQLEAVISSDVKRLDRLITDISAASRLDAELSRTEGEPVEIIKLIDSVVDMYGNGHVKSNVHVDVEITGSNIMIEGAPGRLGQVLRNLIDNALSFSPDEGRVLVRATEEKDSAGIHWVQVDVEDQGPGIPENKLEAIFNRFYTERPQSEGFGRHSGLGLSISKLIIEAHGGSISAKNRMSSDGTVLGAKFTIRLPK